MQKKSDLCQQTGRRGGYHLNPSNFITDIVSTNTGTGSTDIGTDSAYAGTDNTYSTNIADSGLTPVVKELSRASESHPYA